MLFVPVSYVDEIISKALVCEEKNEADNNWNINGELVSSVQASVQH